MKKVFYLSLIIAMIITGCSSGRMYQYQVSMTHPETNKTLMFETDTLKIGFQLQPKFITVNIRNKSETGIKINWDDVSFSVDGKTYRVVHKETSVGGIRQIQPPTTIPPRSVLEDGLFPADKINFMRGIYGSTVTVISDIFPTTDFGNKKAKGYIESLKGKSITVYLPYYLGDKYISAYYNLVIDNIVSKK